MFEKTPVQEKSFKGFLKRTAMRLKEHPRIFAIVRAPTDEAGHRGQKAQ